MRNRNQKHWGKYNVFPFIKDHETGFLNALEMLDWLCYYDFTKLSKFVIDGQLFRYDHATRQIVTLPSKKCFKELNEYENIKDIIREILEEKSKDERNYISNSEWTDIATIRPILFRLNNETFELSVEEMKSLYHKFSEEVFACGWKSIDDKKIVKAFEYWVTSSPYTKMRDKKY